MALIPTNREAQLNADLIGRRAELAELRRAETDAAIELRETLAREAPEVLDRLVRLAKFGGPDDRVALTACLGVLSKVLPTLTAVQASLTTDLTTAAARAAEAEAAAIDGPDVLTGFAAELDAAMRAA